MTTVPFTPDLTLDCPTLDATSHLARRFATVLRDGDIVSLEGDLGAGKTFFTAAAAAALGTKQTIASPTFVLQKIYALPAATDGAPSQIAHYDTYRLDSYDELIDIGFEEMIPASVSFVEWGDRFAAAYPQPLFRIRIEQTGKHARRFFFALPPDRRDAFERAVAEK